MLSQSLLDDQCIYELMPRPGIYFFRHFPTTTAKAKQQNNIPSSC